ncbi:MAG: hypothetical protein L6Q54_05360 [Leptospiraceae bacterium]|nr:hypothetical protein [Leptospiraceae bacterium]MCK6380666.1 hypothetical protein [Leptospiraceae bacterium]NUM41956.1 hypothetical protein [Leptospiraceae bacterium]
MQKKNNNLTEKIPQGFLDDLTFISKKIESIGHECYVVGGGVRDLILGKTPKEFDLTTSARPEEVKSLFSKVIETGIKHGTVTVLLKGGSYEITTFRKDIDYVDGRRPEKIEFGVSLSEDLKRRDFTMNAIALNVLSNEFVDEHDGLADISNRIIRTIGDSVSRFSEDGLRPVRAIRFVSTLAFSIEDETYKAIRETRHVTKKVSVERFHDELNKILTSDDPFSGVYELFKNDIFSLFLNREVEIPENIENIKKINFLDIEPFFLRLFFLFDFLKTEPLPELDLKKLKYSNENTKGAIFYFLLRENCPNLKNYNEIEIRKFLSFVRKHYPREKMQFLLNAFFSFLKIEYTTEDVINFRESIQGILKTNPPLVLSDLKVDGNSIIKKFPEIEKIKIGGILQNCLNRVLEEPNLNTVEGLEKIILLEL